MPNGSQQRGRPRGRPRGRGRAREQNRVGGANIARDTSRDSRPAENESTAGQEPSSPLPVNETDRHEEAEVDFVADGQNSVASSRSTIRRESTRTASNAHAAASSAIASLSSNVPVRKRRLELAAAEERAKITRRRLEAQEQADLEVVNRRLQLQLAELDEAEQGSIAEGEIQPATRHQTAAPSSRIQDWVNSSPSIRASAEREVSPINKTPIPSDMERLAQAMIQAIEIARNRSEDSSANQRLVTRLTAAKELPSFDGDPLEWPGFKRAFETSTELGGYSESENVSRLYRCLRKDARDAVSSLMIAPAKLSQIMETLQLRFGNPDLVARKIGREIRQLPRIDSSKGNLIVFATTVKNCVTAMEAVGHLGYLHSPELHSEIIAKIPEPMIHNYNRYHLMRNEPEKPRMVLLADFLVFEAEIACKAGTADASFHGKRDERERSTYRSKTERKLVEHQKREISLNVREEGSKRSRADNTSTRSRITTTSIRDEDKSCGYCKSRGHVTTKCRRFIELSIRQRWQWAAEARVCFKCLGADHRRDKCRAQACQKSGCEGLHHTLLHIEKRSRSPSVPAKREVDKGSAEKNVSLNTWDDCHRRVLLKVVPVRLYGPKGHVTTYALLDEGSTVTLLDDEYAKKIGVQGTREVLDLHGVDRMRTEIPNSRRVDFQISGSAPDSQKFVVSGARTIPNFQIHRQSVTIEDIKNHHYLDDIDLPLYKTATPKVLIGQDHWDLMIPLEVRTGSKYSPVASLTQLGWVVHGYATATYMQNRRQRVLATISRQGGNAEDETRNEGSDRELHNLVKASFSLDSMGITSSCRKNEQDERAEVIMTQTAKRVAGRWEIGLLWKNDCIQLSDSFPNALKRLVTLEKKMLRDPEFGVAYRGQIQNLLANGYARKLASPPRHNRTWYLPHFGVTNPHKPGKLRMVFDAAAKTLGKSLNDRLLSGPDLLNSLLGVLMRFRQKAIAFTGDIKEMFLQIKIREEDRDSQLFLWRDGDATKEADVYQMTSMIFGASSSPAAALFIKNLNAREFEAEFPRAAEAIIRKHYMDDYLDSVDTVEEARAMINDVSHVHRQGGFEIRGWVANKSEVLTSVPEHTLAKKVVDLSLSEELAERTLGLIWKPNEDTLSFATSFKRFPPEILAGTRRPTKREMLRIIMSVFDPHGLLTPFTVGSKVILQGVWRSGIGWDERLADAEFQEWQKWVERLRDEHLCAIPRCYLARGEKPFSTELHIFCDASQEAFAAVGYWRFTYNDDTHQVAFVAAKSRVAPLRPALTIPRMELQAALLGSRLADTIVAEHDIEVNRRVFWSDARAVLCWIRSTSQRHNAWLANRLGEIDERTNVSEWRWVPTEENPADDATRGNAKIPTPQSRWFRGPSFLAENETHWPIGGPDASEYNTSEDKRTETVGNLIVHIPEALPELTRFSSWTRLIHTTARVLLFLEVYLKKAKPDLTVECLQRAETLWTIRAQRESFGPEIKALFDGKSIAKTSRLIQLTPTVDEKKVLRVNGRVPLIEGVDDNAKSPAILDGRHAYTKLLMIHYHQRAGHGSTEMVLNEIRQYYWVVHARPTLRSLISRCQWCRVHKAKPAPPLMGNLPAARLAHHQRPFTYCGVDYFGPMTVTIGRRREKRWGVLFTCLTTRAVHLEIASSLNTDSAIMALHRFTARRGCPTELWSDNGTNLRGAATELSHAVATMDAEKLQAEAIRQRMTWKFIPPGTPHMGGSWERLVKCVKTALHKTLQGQAPKEETLITALAEAEHSVNSRPLTYVSTDSRDREALTPNHFLIGSSSGVTIPRGSQSSDLCSRRQWQIAQRLADMFWARWLKEYLPTLLPRKKWNVHQPPLREGDVVLLMETNAPRNTWSRGIVTRVIPGTDGVTRVVEVRSGNQTYLRAAVKLIALVPIINGTDG